MVEIGDLAKDSPSLTLLLHARQLHRAQYSWAIFFTSTSRGTQVFNSGCGKGGYFRVGLVCAPRLFKLASSPVIPDDENVCDDEAFLLENAELHDGHYSSGGLIGGGLAWGHALQPWDRIAQWQHHREVVGHLFRRLGADGGGLRCEHQRYRVKRLVLNDSLVEYEGSALKLEHGAVTISTSKLLATRAGAVTVAPAAGVWTEFDVRDVDSRVQIAARKGDLMILGPLRWQKVSRPLETIHNRRARIRKERTESQKRPLLEQRERFLILQSRSELLGHSPWVGRYGCCRVTMMP